MAALVDPTVSAAQAPTTEAEFWDRVTRLLRMIGSKAVYGSVAEAIPGLSVVVSASLPRIGRRAPADLSTQEQGQWALGIFAEAINLILGGMALEIPGSNVAEELDDLVSSFPQRRFVLFDEPNHIYAVVA